MMKNKYEDLDTMFQETQVSHLLDSGFTKENITTDVMDIRVEESCKYYAHNKMIAPTVIKQ
jgi:guanidinoacetate N-methyltransferase